MASSRAVYAVAEAIIRQLRAEVRPGDFDSPVEFGIYGSADFSDTPIANGVSLFLYRILPNGIRRTPPGGLGPDGRQRLPRLPIEVHFLMTVWAGQPSLQHALAGWMMRAMEDMSLMNSSMLNAAVPGTFAPEETVEISLSDLRTEDLLRIYEVLSPNLYQLSIPYLARVIEIEARTPALDPAGPLVQEREQQVGLVERPPAFGEAGT
jgi:hypothetical protein